MSHRRLLRQTHNFPKPMERCDYESVAKLLTISFYLGSEMNPTRLVSSTLLVKKITIASAHSPTHKQMFSWSVSASPHPLRSKTCARNGSLKSTTIVLGSLASSSGPKPIFVTTHKSEISYPSSVCSRSARKMGSAWQRIWGR